MNKILEGTQVLESKEGKKCACGEGNDVYRHTFEITS